MSRLLCFILLCSTCTIVIASKGFFSWMTFRPAAGKSKTLIDFSQLTLEDFEVKNGSSTQVVKYIQGPLIFKEQFQDSEEVHYLLYELNKNDQLERRVEQTVSFCTFFDQFFKNNMLPVLENRNDIPRGRRSVCPIAPKTYHISKAKSFSELLAPTMLVNAKYVVNVMILKNNKEVGGFAGKFMCTKV